MLVTNYKTTRCHEPENHKPHAFFFSFEASDFLLEPLKVRDFELNDSKHFPTFKLLLIHHEYRSGLSLLFPVELFTTLYISILSCILVT